MLIVESVVHAKDTQEMCKLQMDFHVSQRTAQEHNILTHQENAIHAHQCNALTHKQEQAASDHNVLIELSLRMTAKQNNAQHILEVFQTAENVKVIRVLVDNTLQPMVDAYHVEITLSLSLLTLVEILVFTQYANKIKSSLD